MYYIKIIANLHEVSSHRPWRRQIKNLMSDSPLKHNKFNYLLNNNFVPQPKRFSQSNFRSKTSMKIFEKKSEKINAALKETSPFSVNNLITIYYCLYKMHNYII